MFLQQIINSLHEKNYIKQGQEHERNKCVVSSLPDTDISWGMFKSKLRQFEFDLGSFIA